MGTIYLIRAIGSELYKIGYTSRTAEQRLSAIQSATPFRLVLIATREGDKELESALHFHFRHQREHREWFRLGDSPLRAENEFLGWEWSDRERDLDLWYEERSEATQHRMSKRFRYTKEEMRTKLAPPPDGQP